MPFERPQKGPLEALKRREGVPSSVERKARIKSGNTT